MSKRSPRYPRISLSKAVELARRLFADVHTSKVDVDAAARVLGYSSAANGTAAIAIGSLRQFGLVDGLRGDISVSELAMQILQPLDEDERIRALHQAARNPEVFASVLGQFNGRLPASGEPIKAFLIRQEGFSPAGADDLIGTLRETMDSLPPAPMEPTTAASRDADIAPPTADGVHSAVEAEAVYPPSRQTVSQSAPAFVAMFPVGAGSVAEVKITGAMSERVIDRLIKHLELMKDSLQDE